MLLNQTILVAVSCVYAVSGALFFAFLLRGNDKLGRLGVLTLLGAFLGQLGFLVLDHFQSGTEWRPTGIHTTLEIVSSLIVFAFLVASGNPRVRILGVFIVPLALVFFLGSGLTHDAPQEIRTYLLPLHIGLNVFGVVAFALASVVASAYVIQEYLLRKKRVGGIFRRLPSLDTLDSLEIRLVTLGFPLLTLGILTGTLWARRLHEGAGLGLSASQSMAFVSWAVFGAVLVLRYSVGWRGRRAAIGTLVGFGCALLVLLGYALRSVGAGG